VSVAGLDHLVIAVSDHERSGRFYREVLGAEEVETERGRRAYRIGGSHLIVHGPGARPSLVARRPVQPGNSDLCFVWGGPIEGAIDHLRQHAVELLEGPVERVGAAGPGRSVYFSDPDGSLLELISYSEESSKVSAQPLMQ
jgi:catechol 2,3-dioxygenase-like lactoylglutathione lyase family enzyme